MCYRYSIIIPIYNAEKTVNRCLDSLLAQQRKDVELIVIDDGSTDSSNCICATYARTYRHIQFITQENRGVSCARNAGLDAATGEYILFVDSDDYVYDGMFSALDNVLQTSNIDLLCFRAANRRSAGTFFCSSLQAIARKSIELEHLGVLASPGAKVFKRDKIEQLHLRFHSELAIGEDLVFVYAYLLHAHTLAAIDGLFYHVTLDNPESLSRKRRDNLCDQSIIMRRQMLADLNNAGLSNDLYQLFYQPLSWGFYHGVYSVCKELLKDPKLTARDRRNRIKNICRRFSACNIKPQGYKCRLIALPVQLRMARTIDLLCKLAVWRRSKHG